MTTTKKFNKVYIGKGRIANPKLPGVIAVSLEFDALEALTFEYDGKRYIKFEVAPLRAADNFGRTHTAYVSQMEEAEEEKPAPKPRRTNKKKEEPVPAETDDNMPF